MKPNNRFNQRVNQGLYGRVHSRAGKEQLYYAEVFIDGRPDHIFNEDPFTEDLTGLNLSTTYTNKLQIANAGYGSPRSLAARVLGDDYKGAIHIGLDKRHVGRSAYQQSKARLARKAKTYRK